MNSIRFLILAHPTDETARRVHAMLQARHGPNDVRLVFGEELVNSPYWVHHLRDGRVNTELRLNDGTVIRSEKIGVVFNRLLTVSVPYFESVIDREYAGMEMYALCLSWLTSLPCPVVNSTSTTGLGAHMRSHAEWLFLAGKAGLPVRGFHFTSDPRWIQEKTYFPHRPRSVWGAHEFDRILDPPVSREPTFYLEELSERQESILVAAPNVLGSLSSLYGEQLKCLAKMTGCDLLQVLFTQVAATKIDPIESNNWKVAAVTTFPSVDTVAEISAIGQVLESKLMKSREKRARRR